MSATTMGSWPDLKQHTYISSYVEGFKFSQKMVGGSISTIALMTYLNVVIIIVAYRVHSWVRLLVAVPAPAPCIAPSITMNANQQGRSFRVSAKWISP